MAKARDTRVEVIVAGERHEFSSMEELMVDRDDLDEEMAHQAAHFAWFSILRERARMAKNKLEDKLDRVEKDLFMKYKEGGEKMTVEALKSKVRTSKAFADVLEDYREAEYTEGLLGSFVTALSQRKDTIIALARNRNFEMSTPSADEVSRIKKNLLGG